MRLFEKKSKYFCCILLGMYLFYIGRMLHEYVFINSKWSRVVSLVGVLALGIGILLIRKSTSGCDKQIKAVYYVLLIVCLFHIIIGIPFCKSIGLLLFSPQYLWMFVLPVVFLIPVTPQFVSLLFRWSLVYVLTSLVFSFYCFNDFFYNAQDLMASMIGWEAYVVNRPQEPAILLYPVAAFSILIPKISRKWQVVIIVAAILATGAGMMAGRRSATAILVALLWGPVIVGFFCVKKKMMIVGAVLILIFISAIGVSNNKIEYAFEETFPILANRIDSDTRSGTEEDFYKDMRNTTDWVFGRGMNGTYKSPSVASIDQLNRVGIETGYLNIILHGGLLMLIPYMILLLYASYKGFFHSNSLFLKACSFYVFMHVLMLYPEGTPKLTLEYFILFIFIRMCVSEKWRLLK